MNINIIYSILNDYLLYYTMVKYLVLTLLGILYSSLVVAQPGNPFVLRFPPIAYQSDSYTSSPQNWGMIQDERGLMYFGNTSGVLEFDGVSWRMIPGTEDMRFYRFAKDQKGRIYTGGANQLGYLAPNKNGQLQFFSLLSYLTKAPKQFRVNRTECVGDTVYFQTESHIFGWNGKVFTIWKSHSGFTRLLPFQDQLFVLEKEKGLSVFQNGQLVPVPGGKQFSNLDVLSLIPHSDNKSSDLQFLALTYDKGLYQYAQSQVAPFLVSPSSILDQTFLMNGVALQNGTIALATTSTGIVILNKEGKILRILDKKSGLTDNCVLSLYPDKENGLWVGLNKGISRVSYPSPVNFLQESAGLDGIVYTILRTGKKLYAGTALGLYVLNEQDLIPTFTKVPQIEQEVWSVQTVGDQVLVASTLGVYVLWPGGVRLVSPTSANRVYYALLLSRKNPHSMYVGLSDGVGVLSFRKGQWEWNGKIQGLNHQVVWLAEDREGRVWATSYEQASRIDFAKGAGELLPRVEQFTSKQGFTQDLMRFQVTNIKDQIIFGTNKGIYRYDEVQKQLKPDKLFNEAFHNASRETINVTEDSQGAIWLTSRFRSGKLTLAKNNTYTWDTIPLSTVPKTDVWTIYADKQGVLWLGTTEGIFTHDPSVIKNYTSSGNTLIRSIRIVGDTTLFAGTFSGKGYPSTKQPEAGKFTLPYGSGDLRFDFASTSYDAPEKIQYSYMLEGENNTWSAWSAETNKGFNGLREGKYVFRVKSRNIFGLENAQASFAFGIMPPYYRTWWAYTLYGLMFVFLTWAIIKINYYRLILSKKKLEAQVEERTRELVAEKQKSENLLLNILPAETAQELKMYGKAKARNYDMVTVLFTDFKGFTQFSEKLSPQELVAEIDCCFSAFDRIIGNYSIEKIKTIGDAYMCAGGIPNPNIHNPIDVVKAGLEMLSFIENLKKERETQGKEGFDIRIGIHSGPVVAGIVGIKKFAYDIWGDTVNTAARMEASGEVGKLNISGTTYQLIKTRFHCQYRGKVEAKHKGQIDMYFVEVEVKNSIILET